MIGVVLLGAVMGSFVGAQVWRIRARQLREDLEREAELRKKKKPTDSETEEYEGIHRDNLAVKNERKRLAQLLNKDVRADRSRCLSCGNEIKWYDLLPIISWLNLGGKCRYCHSPIGWTEILLELGLSILFGLSVYWWPSFDMFGCIQIALWMVALVLLAILFVYDARWFLLPNKVNWAFIATAAIYAGTQIYQSSDLITTIVSLLGSIGVLSGLYLVLYLVSHGRWIGFGDVKLGLGLGLFLGDWTLAFIALFLANFFGTLIVLPGMFRGTIKKEAHIPFGPLLIAGFLITWFIGDSVVSWYTMFV